MCFREIEGRRDLYMLSVVSIALAVMMVVIPKFESYVSTYMTMLARG